MSRRPSAFTVLPVLVVALVAVVASIRLAGSDGDAPTSPVDVDAAGPAFATLDELVAASDRIVVGTVTAVGHGRTLADAADPDAGIITQLAGMRVERSLDHHGGTTDIVIEQEASLLDGTPIVVNGLAALTVGDRGIAFLVDGASEQFPYHALVNEQGWMPLDGDEIRTDRADLVHAGWDGRSFDDLAAALA